MRKFLGSLCQNCLLPLTAAVCLSIYGSGGPGVSAAPGLEILTKDACAASDHYTIALLLSRAKKAKNQAYILGAKFRAEAINRAGGIRGKAVCLVLRDDEGKSGRTVEIVADALADPRIIAMVGLNSSSNAQGVVASIGASGVPLLSDISVDRLFTPYDNVFTMSKSVSDDTRAFTGFLKENYKSAIFVGNVVTAKDGVQKVPDLFAQEFLHALKGIGDGVSLKATHWIEKADRATLDAIVADIRRTRPDILCLAVWTGRGAAIVRRLASEGIAIPIFFATGSIFRIGKITKETPYKGAFFQIGGRIPNLVSERLAELDKRADIRQLRSDLGSNLGDGIIYSDLLAMIAEVANREKEPLEPAKLRGVIVAGLRGFREGRRIFSGLWRNWSFTRERASARNAFVLWAPDGGANQRLWKVQSIRFGGGVTRVPVAYVSIDLVRIHSIDANSHTFDAEFYLSLSGDGPIVLDKVAFSNAVKGGTGNPLVQITEINPARGAADGPTADPTGEIVKLYNVKGRFLFNPKLSKYPFDSQRFSVAFKPVDTAHPFLIQPPEPRLLDREADIDGWTLTKGRGGQYVGSDRDIITTVRSHGTERHIQPYYKFNFSWVAKRLTIDYYVRVVVPLTLIMMVAYFSVFLPSAQVNSVVAMQVTSLLATIALYFSIPKLDTETATLSDQIFVFGESVIVLLIMISILRVNLIKRERSVLALAMKGTQVVVFPILVVVMFLYVRAVSSGEIKPLTEIGWFVLES